MAFPSGMDYPPIVVLGIGGADIFGERLRERRVMALDIDKLAPGESVTIARSGPGAELGHEWATITICKPEPSSDAESAED